MIDNYLLDTHILLWTTLNPAEISPEIKKNINTAQNNNALHISSITLWEIAMLTHKKRINVYSPVKDFLQSIKELPGLSIIDLSPDIAAESTMLLDNFHGDPADRLIVASTKVENITLITRDHKILEWAKLGHIKAIQG